MASCSFLLPDCMLPTAVKAVGEAIVKFIEHDGVKCSNHTNSCVLHFRACDDHIIMNYDTHTYLWQIISTTSPVGRNPIFKSIPTLFLLSHLSTKPQNNFFKQGNNIDENPHVTITSLVRKELVAALEELGYESTQMGILTPNSIYLETNETIGISFTFGSEEHTENNQLPLEYWTIQRDYSDAVWKVSPWDKDFIENLRLVLSSMKFVQKTTTITILASYGVTSDTQ
jgi:hypothetical protein